MFIRVSVMVLSAIFNNISVISLRSVLLAEETGVPRNHRPAACHCQTLSHNVVLIPILKVNLSFYRKLFWTDRGFPPKIESSNLDGSGRKDIVKEDIVWPNGWK
jgi:hypothetical protein